MALLMLGLVVVVVCGTSVDLLTEDDQASIEASDASAEQVAEVDTDSTALFQTYVRVASQSQRPGDGVNESAPKVPVHTLEKMWRWLTQASTEDVSDPMQRSHKDFIAAALLITCVLPWSCQSRSAGEGRHRATMDRLSRILPSGQTLRYLCVALLWSKHYYFKGQHTFVEIALVVVGILFDSTERHIDHEDDMWRRLSECVPQRFAHLYPFYSLHVIVCYLVFFSAPCAALENFLGGNLLPFYASGILAWASSLFFAIYLAVTLLSHTPEDLQSTSIAMLHAGCIAMLVLPRTLAAPVHGPWTWSEEKAYLLKANPDAGLFELFFARRSLLLALAHFFLGLALARIRPWMVMSFSDSEVTEPSKEPQVEMASVCKLDEDVWKAFEEEAKRDMIRSLSISKAAESRDSEGYSISPRSNSSD